MHLFETSHLRSCFVHQARLLDGNYRFLTRHEALTTAFMCASGQGGRWVRFWPTYLQRSFYVA